MKIKFKTGGLLINLLVSVAISLIVNFSYFVMMILSSSSGSGRTMAKHNPFDNISFISYEMIFYIVLAFILLTIFTIYLSETKINRGSYWKRAVICLAVAVVLYFFAPYMKRGGDITLILFAKRLFNPMVLLKCSFTLVVAALYGKIYELLYQKQNITIENERLRNENLQSRYDVLVNQINPHFFFNSLNSLSMLVRESNNEDALTYIDRLSDTFRYIIESGRKNMTTLGDELRFAEAYKYLFEVRYAGKFFLDIDVDEKYMDRTLPALSLQPLIENAVKHNAITRNTPLHISVKADEHWLTVSNRIAPKIENPEEGTGIGLKNISTRYQLMTGKDIVVLNNGESFTVKLPLSK